jgi:tetratricopeptide (TPR) repeat protein/predicted phosphodiesterase
MGGLTWLHLSDWHQKDKKEKEFDRQVVRDALIRDIKNRTAISQDLEKIDFIVFSGDVAFSGKPEEYEAAKEELFKPLLRACNLSPENLFIAPGNHDLDRAKFGLLPAPLLRPLESNIEAKDWLFDGEKRLEALKPLKAFTNFVTQYNKQENSDYANTRKLEINGKKIALLGINSAWMCGRRKNSKDEIDDKGVVVVGEPQIHNPLEDVSEFDIKIVVLHHPFEWLAEFESSQIMSGLMKGCDFILRGHQHEPQVAVIRSTLGDCVVIPAGACYDRRIYANAYNFVHLDFESGSGVVFLRCWNGKDKWREDIDSCSGGKFEFLSPVLAADNLPKTNDSQEIQVADVIDQHKQIVDATIPTPRQVPPPPADFKGREEEIRDILDNFDKGATITGLRGMAGVGKTVLAFELAERLKDRFPDGQLFINLQGTSKSPLSPTEAMAQVIHAYRPTDRLPENQDELRGLYLSILAGKRVLLLFDNAASKEQVEPLLPPANCAVLITSRIRFTLPGLKEKDLDVLPTDKACELLLGIAGRIGDRAEELAKLCGYLPLALRNAASALAEKRDLVVGEYERLLSDKRKRLELVEASFSLSYDLLSPIGRKQWGRLSVFPEDFDLNSAAAVWKMGRDPSAEALSDLVKWSLVIFIPLADLEEEGRYRLHDLARIFADSRLDSSNRTDALYRHSKHYLKVLSEAERLYIKGGMNVLPALRLFDREWVNIKAGRTWAEGLIQNSGKMKKDIGRKYALQLANSYPTGAIEVLQLRLYPQDRIHWDETALAAARMMKDRVAEVWHLHNLGIAYSDLGEARRAIECYEHSLSGKRKIEYGINEGRLLNCLGVVYFNLGETRKAIEHYKQAQSIASRVNDRRGEVPATGNLGSAHLHLGDTGKAIEYYQQQLAIAQEIGDRNGEGNAIGNQGDAYFHLGETHKAIEYYEQHLAIALEIGDRDSEGWSLISIGDSYLDLGKTCKAIRCFEQALEISRNLRSRKMESYAFCCLGRAYADSGDTQKGIEYYEQAMMILRKIEYRNFEGEVLCNIGRAYADLGESSKAIENYNQALEIVRKTEHKKIEDDALCNLGRVYADLNAPSKAIEYLNPSLEIARKIEYRRGEATALFNMSLALAKLGQRKEAIDNAEAALNIFERIESPLAEKVRSKLAEWKIT